MSTAARILQQDVEKGLVDQETANKIAAAQGLTLPMSTQTGGTRDVMLESGDPASMINLGREQAGQVADSSAYQKFGLALMDLLKQQQTMGTRKFEEAGLAGREAAAERVLQAPQDLIGAHPSIQAGVRSAQAGAMQPQISGAREMGQTFSEQLRSFGDSLSQAAAIGSWMEGIDKDERQEMMSMLQNYPDAVKSLTADEKRAYEKKLKLPTGFIDQMPTTQGQVMQYIDLGDRTIGVDKQGNQIVSYPKGLSPSSGLGGLGGLGEYGYTPQGFSQEDMDRLGALGLSPHQAEIVAGIVEGTQPPIMTIQRTAEITKILAGLQALGYDNTKAVQDWTVMSKTLANLGSDKAMTLRRAIIALEGSTQQAERLYAAWQATGLPTGFSNYNKVALEASARLPGEAGVAARTLLSHIEDMAAELAVIYRGGGQATDDALAQAQKSLSADWNEAQFNKNLALIRENLQIRRNSIMTATSELFETTGNIYDPGWGGTSPSQGGTVEMYGMTFRQNPDGSYTRIK